VSIEFAFTFVRPLILPSTDRNFLDLDACTTFESHRLLVFTVRNDAVDRSFLTCAAFLLPSSFLQQRLSFYQQIEKLLDGIKGYVERSLEAPLAHQGDETLMRHACDS